MIILCHKCKGLLLGHDEAPKTAYKCGCMSGYVRDWQTPTKATSVIAEQIVEQRDRLKLYIGQKRAPTNWHVVWTKQWLAENDV